MTSGINENTENRIKRPVFVRKSLGAKNRRSEENWRSISEKPRQWEIYQQATLFTRVRSRSIDGRFQGLRASGFNAWETKIYFSNDTVLNPNHLDLPILPFLESIFGERIQWITLFGLWNHECKQPAGLTYYFLKELSSLSIESGDHAVQSMLEIQKY